jgi:hypothetical protein
MNRLLVASAAVALLGGSANGAAFAPRAEYDFRRFGSSNPGPLVCTPAVCGFGANNVGITHNVNVLKAGLNFNFTPSF